MTVLRDPVERTLSALRHMRERDAEFRGKPLEEIYADPIKFRCLIQNHMVKMLAITREEMTDGVLTVLELDADPPRASQAEPGRSASTSGACRSTSRSSATS